MPLKNVAIIFNGIKARGFINRNFGYGYGYGYGSYYEEEHPPQTVLEKALNILDIRKLFKKKKRSQ